MDEPSAFANESFPDEWSRKLVAHISSLSSQATMQRQYWERIEPFHLAAQQTFQGPGSRLGTAECLRNRTTRYLQRGLYYKAEELCEQALEWALMVNEDELRATVLHTMAAIKSVTGDISESVKILRLCLADLHTIGNTIGQAHVLLNIGYHQRRLGEYHAALSSLDEALAIALEIHDLRLAAVCYMNMGRCHLALNDSAHLQSAIADARLILPELHSVSIEAELNLLECKGLMATGNTDDAVVLLNKTYQLAAQNNLAALRADVQFEQGVLYKKIGEMQTAACKLVAAAQQYRQLGFEGRYDITIGILDELKKVVDV